MLQKRMLWPTCILCLLYLSYMIISVYENQCVLSEGCELLSAEAGLQQLLWSCRLGSSSALAGEPVQLQRWSLCKLDLGSCRKIWPSGCCSCWQIYIWAVALLSKLQASCRHCACWHCSSSLSALVHSIREVQLRVG